MVAMFNGQPVFGPPGVTFTPSVSADGELSWTNDGGLDNPDPFNIKGDKGDPGPQIEVDTTLTIEGAAADAATTGQGLSQLKDDVSGLENTLFSTKKSVNLWNPATTVVGQLNKSGVLNPEATDYVATDFIQYKAGERIWVCFLDTSYGTIIPNTPKISNGSCLCVYNSDKEFVRYVGGDTLSSAGRGYEITDSDCAYIRLGWAKAHFTNPTRIYCLSKTDITDVYEFEPYYAPIVTKNFEEYHVRDTVVSCRGDSLTDGTGGNDYPKLLANLLGEGYVVNNFGIGGEGVKNVARRMGAVPIYAQPFTIPTSGPVQIKIKDITGEDVSSLMLRGGTKPAYITSVTNFNVNPVIIAGVKGTIEKTSAEYSDPWYTFTRSADGPEKTIARPELISTKGYRDNRKDVTVFWCGTNDSQTWKGSAYIIKYLKNMISTLRHDRYIVVGLTCKSLHNDIDSKNAALMDEFGIRYLDIRSYLLQYGLDDAGIEPTTQDTADIESGEIPTSLRTDVVHFNSNGYAVIANQVYRKGIELGYWA